MRHYSRTEIAKALDHMVGERLPGCAEQGIHQLSTTQKYKIGSRLQIGSKVYHYGRAGGVLSPNVGAKVKNPQDVLHENCAAALAGATSLTITLTVANNDGPTYDGLVPANYFEGGTVVIYAVLGTIVRGILANTAILVNPGTATCVLILDAPLPVATGAVWTAVIASPYACVVINTETKLNDVLHPVAGVPTRITESGDYLWLQTWGPCWISPNPLHWGAANLMAVYFGGDGAIQDHSGDAGIQQYAGWYMGQLHDGTIGEPFVFLQLDP